jgi:autotransporter-associated beta strand protein
LTVTLVDTSYSQNLIWGSTASFLQESSVLNFGSTTSNNGVFFESNMDFGPTANFNGLYSRVISVTANSTDSGDPVAYADFTELDGVLSSNSNPYAGLTKTGTGLLVLNNTNTYTGATTIAQGTLAIVDDSGLGTAPTAAYALNTSPGVSGNALTPGALEINGGAGLLIGWEPGDVTLSSNRQVLLASGSTGATPAIFDVAGSTSLSYNTLYYGGTIADYINEKGSLEKQGGGTFNYSGTAANTGTFGVTAGTMVVSGAGSVNSASGVTINNKSADTKATAQFNYASSVALSTPVSYGTGGGVFAYNSSAAYTGGAMALAAKDVVAGAGNLGLTALTINSGGTLMPGNYNGQLGTTTTGTLKLGAVTLMGGGNYNFLLADMTGAAGTGYSTVTATSLNLTGLTTPFDLNLESLNGTAPGAAAHFNPAGDYDFVLFTTGANGITPATVHQLDSEFAIYVSANDGATGFTSSSGHWYVYENNNYSQLILHYSAVPEPGTWAMLLSGLGLLVFIRRVRSRAT